MAWRYVDLHEGAHPEPAEARTCWPMLGADALGFLQGLLSADVANLGSERAVPAALLTVKGKLVAELLVWHELAGDAGPPQPWVSAPVSSVEVVRATFEERIIMDDVELGEVCPRPIAVVYDDQGGAGPLASDAVRAGGVLARATIHPVPGLLLVGPVGGAAALQGVLAELEARPVDAREWRAGRVGAGAPAWGAELRPGRFPAEVGFASAVSHSKGCFLGQEPLARLHARGRVNWVMVRVQGEGPPPAEAALSADGLPDAGTLTTVTAPDQHGRWAGLAIVRRACARPGVELSAGSTSRARVISEPIGDDPGVAGRS